MKTKKGFTLIELLGVFTLLGVIAVLITPYIIGLLQKSKDNEYNDFKNTLFLAAQSYINTTNALFDSAKTKNHIEVISVKDLIDTGFINGDLIDPKKNKQINNLNNSIKINLRTNEYEYIEDKYYETDGLKLWYDGYRKTNENGIWRDASGNDNDGILTNFDQTGTSGSTNHGSIIFDGGNDYVESSKLINYSNVTIEIVGKLLADETISPYNNNFYNDGVSSILYNTHAASSGISQNNIGFSVNGTNGVEASFLINTVTSIVGTYESLNHNSKIYLNGDHRNTETCNMSSNEEGKILIGTNRDKQFFTNMEIYAIRVYNKALTQEQITSNYNMDKIRFNIQ